MTSIGSTEATLGAIARARSVEASAYVLRTGSPFVGALATAAHGGAAVRVWADGKPYRDDGGMRRATLAAAGRLRAAGARVDVVTSRRVHLKAAVVDGVAYLNDRNWTGGRDTVLRLDDPAEVGLVRAAIEGGATGSDGSLATAKGAALELEAQVIRDGAGAAVDAESEALGSGPGPYAALEARARGGARVRLIVSSAELRGRGGARERAALAALARAGVAVRVGSARSGAGNEKLCVAGDAAWTGSANATYGQPAQCDWGVRTHDPALVGALRARFARNWAASHAYRA